MNSSFPGIAIRVSGGLGNQLFQLSAGLYVSKKYHNSVIHLDVKSLSSYETPRNLDINFFISLFPNVRISPHPSLIALLAFKFRLARFIDNFFLGYGFISSSKILKNVSASERMLLIDGYFQDPSIAETIFSCKDLYQKIEDEYGPLKNQLLDAEKQKVVGIHIRRGDYVSSKAASGVFNTISLDFYRQAVNMFPVNFAFLVFGDDASMVSKFAKEINGISVPTMGLSTIQEFMLLTICDHYIIANSTFSWWASYLGWNKKKRVISPKNWYRNAKRNSSNPLLLPYFEVLHNDTSA